MFKGRSGTTYDGLDRVVKTEQGTTATSWQTATRVQNTYDSLGRKLRTEDPDSGIWATRYDSVGGSVFASDRVWAPLLAGMPGDPAIELAGASATQPAVILLVRHDWQLPLALAAGLLATGMLVAPWRRKAVVGIRLRHGQVLLVIVAFAVMAMPLPILVRPAQAGGTGPTPTPIPNSGTPTRTPTAPGAATEMQYYHLDHLGSVSAITDSTGSVRRYVRYKPYGEVRGIYDRYGISTQETLGTDGYDKGFTGYSSEPISGLSYAGARVYDPVLGSFLSHDPARQYANPYAYGPGDPINGTDPSGAFFGLEFLIAAAIGFAVGFAATAINAAANGASTGQALKAGAIGGAIGAAGAVLGVTILQPALGAIASPIANAAGATAATVQEAITVTTLSGGLFASSHSAGQGDYTGLIGLGLSIGIGLAWTYANGGGAADVGSGASADREVFGGMSIDPTAENPGMSAQRGSIGIEGDVLSYDEATSRLKMDKITGQVISDLEAGSAGRIKVITNTTGFTQSYPQYGKVAWNPRLGLITPNGGIQSPSFLLGHELVHIHGFSPALHATQFPGITDLEEARVIFRWEVQAAGRLGEGYRYSHRGRWLAVSGPLGH